MNLKSSTEKETEQNQMNNETKKVKGTSDFVVGSVTFIVFLIFMTVWMYFQG